MSCTPSMLWAESSGLSPQDGATLFALRSASEALRYEGWEGVLGLTERFLTDSEASLQRESIQTSPNWLKGLVLLLIVLPLVIGSIFVVGVVRGRRDHLRLTQEAAEQHYVAGLAHLENGEQELGIAELEQVLRR